MAADVLDGAALRRMIEAGAARLRQGEARVNALNVFPVPDGDTGRNMNLTMQAVLEELERVPPSASLSDVARAAAAGSLRGARGNSGVILSQFFRGFELAFRGLDRTSPVGLAAAFRRAADTAYQMVMRPVEGTILTVMRAAAEQADRAARAGAGLQALLEQSLQAARDALARTPEMLEVLKKAGVVDAGGQGLVLVLEGFLEAQRSTGGAAAAAPEAGASAPGAAGSPPGGGAPWAPGTLLSPFSNRGPSPWPATTTASSTGPAERCSSTPAGVSGATGWRRSAPSARWPPALLYGTSAAPSASRTAWSIAWPSSSRPAPGCA
nr:hypothetical protein [Bacillota bacterium]